MTLRKSAKKPAQRWFALAGMVGALTLVASAIALAAHPEVSLTGSNFEIDIDANLKVDDASPSIDWENVPDVRNNDAPTGRNDDSYAGGSKEDDPCPGTTTGSIPNNKSDLLTFGTYVETEADGPGFLHLFWTRVNEPSGTTLMDFELNKSTTDCGNGVNPLRTTGDLLIEYRIEQGGATATLKVREWSGAAWGDAQDLTAVGAATGTINNSSIPAAQSDGLITSGSISPRTFGEASLDLSFIFDEGECESFGSAFLKSRASDSFTSQLKDYIAPVPVELSNCGQLTVKKIVDPAESTQEFDFTIDPDSNSDGTQSLGHNDEYTFQDLLAGDYTLDETLPDATWEITSIECDDADETTGDTSTGEVTVTVNADDDITCTYTNTRLTGSILVAKEDNAGEPLDGAAFEVDPGDIGMTPVGTGLFCTDGLILNTEYTVTETSTPAGYETADPQPFTPTTASTCDERVDEGEVVDGDAPDLTFVNVPSPGTVTIEKQDDDGNPLAEVGFTLYVDAAPLGSFDEAIDTVVAASEVLTDGDGIATFANIAPGDYCAVETTPLAGYTEADPNYACDTLAIGEDSTLALGPLENPQEHTVIVLVCHDGTDLLAPSDVTINPGTGEAETKTSLAAGTLTEAQQQALCALLGATWSGLDHGNTDFRVDVGSDAHNN